MSLIKAITIITATQTAPFFLSRRETFEGENARILGFENYHERFLYEILGMLHLPIQLI